MLPPYGCDWVHAPNFARLAARGVTFDHAYVGSMPCMPARRELHTGRYNFLHRAWGPLEPFDDSMPELLKQHGVYTHLASDHYHYWEEGGCTYHTRYNSWDISRGQEGDPWKGDLNDPPFPHPNPQRDRHGKQWNRQDWVNRAHMLREEDQPQAKTFAQGLEFLEQNHARDNWFLHLETFDPHEPYFVPDAYKALYPFRFDPRQPDWPDYAPVGAGQQELVTHLRQLNAALISMCDAYLGRVLDAMDRYDLWKDTMLIVNTDHGFLLGEHDWWGKCRMPFYDEVAHAPLFVWDPRASRAGERRASLVQTIDLPATLLEYFGVPRPPDMQGVPLRETVATDRPVREAALFGLHGAHVNVTDGRYVYMRAPAAPANEPLYNYTHMPTHMRHTFSVEEMRRLEGLAEPFAFTKGCRTMKIRATPNTWVNPHDFGTLLFDLHNDPGQRHPIRDARIETNMIAHLVRLMRENDAPSEQYQRLGLPAPG
jgi:arylsulfatase A-like enzyme